MPTVLPQGHPNAPLLQVFHVCFGECAYVYGDRPALTVYRDGRVRRADFDYDGAKAWRYGSAQLSADALANLLDAARKAGLTEPGKRTVGQHNYADGGGTVYFANFGGGATAISLFPTWDDNPPAAEAALRAVDEPLSALAFSWGSGWDEHYLLSGQDLTDYAGADHPVRWTGAPLATLFDGSDCARIEVTKAQAALFDGPAYSGVDLTSAGHRWQVSGRPALPGETCATRVVPVVQEPS